MQIFGQWLCPSSGRESTEHDKESNKNNGGNEMTGEAQFASQKMREWNQSRRERGWSELERIDREWPNQGKISSYKDAILHFFDVPGPPW